MKRLDITHDACFMLFNQHFKEPFPLTIAVGTATVEERGEKTGWSGGPSCRLSLCLLRPDGKGLPYSGSTQQKTFSNLLCQKQKLHPSWQSVLEALTEFSYSCGDALTSLQTRLPWRSECPLSKEVSKKRLETALLSWVCIDLHHICLCANIHCTVQKQTQKESHCWVRKRSEGVKNWIKV